MFDNLNYELIFAARIVVATVLGALIGIDRELHGKEGGIKIYATISMAACVMTLLSVKMFPDGQGAILVGATMIAAGLIAGGRVIDQDDKLTGLTAAAFLVSTAAVGISIGYGMYLVGSVTSALIIFMLIINDLPFWEKQREKER
jgi:putative Mg2+ transporter-C (MgtC) family protein